MARSRDRAKKPPAAATPFIEEARPRDVVGLVSQRERAVRALEETSRVLRSGEIERAGERAVRELEESLTAAPEAGDPRVITARVVASPERDRPAVPLAGIGVRLKVKGRVLGEGITNALGLAALRLDEEPPEARYELEVLRPDRKVLACQAGRWTPRGPSETHLFELRRDRSLKPHLERARPFEDGLRQARERAKLAREVTATALKAQEMRLVEYVKEIDAEIGRAREGPESGGTRPKERPERPQRR